MPFGPPNSRCWKNWRIMPRPRLGPSWNAAAVPQRCCWPPWPRGAAWPCGCSSTSHSGRRASFGPSDPHAPAPCTYVSHHSVTSARLTGTTHRCRGCPTPSGSSYVMVRLRPRVAGGTESYRCFEIAYRVTRCSSLTMPVVRSKSTPCSDGAGKPGPASRSTNTRPASSPSYDLQPPRRPDRAAGARVRRPIRYRPRDSTLYLALQEPHQRLPIRLTDQGVGRERYQLPHQILRAWPASHPHQPLAHLRQRGERARVPRRHTD